MTKKTQKWIDELIEKLKENFKERFLLAVLVGSQARDDADEFSDTDINVILDIVETEDINKYREIIESLDNSIVACGYLGSLAEIKIWPKYDLVVFYLGSKVLYGNIKEIVPEINNNDIKNNVLNMLSVINHCARHSIIYDNVENAVDLSQDLYKSAFFVMQYIHYLKTGIYIPKRKDLKEKVSESDAVIIDMYGKWKILKNERKNNPDDFLNVIERWSTEKFKEIEEIQ